METQNIRGVVFDWAGTMIDYGSRAPAAVFQEIFRREGIEITAAQAREPMGMAKREHIAAILAMPDVSQRWQQIKNAVPGDQDIDKMYKDFLPLQKEVLEQHCDLIPGAVEAFQWCVDNQLRVGSSTGYTRELMEIVVPIANAAGYQPEFALCAEDAPQGRPAPWLLFEAAKRLNIYPMNEIVKIDDTTVGVQAGLNAGAWTVGVAGTGNLIGLSQDEWSKLSESERSELLSKARQTLKDCGAHFVVDGVAEVPAVIEQLRSK